MKKCVLLFIGAIFSITGSFAQTNLSSHFSVNTTLTAANSPYVVTTNLNVNEGVTLTIEKGVEIRFNGGTYLHVLGTLNAKGVRFTANSSTNKGFWDGIYVSYDGYNIYGNVTLDSCTVEYASNLYCRKGTLTLKKTTLNNFSDMGVRLYSQGILNLTETNIKNCNYPLHLNGPGSIKNGGGNTLTGNTNNTVYFQFQDIPGNFNMPDLGIPYRCDYMRVTETGNLMISPGVTIWFVNCEFTVQGKIKALGTVDKPITFTMHPGVSYWLGVNVSANSIDTACIFRNCIIQNAIYDYEWYCAMEINAASPTFENCKFTGNCRNLNVTGISKPVFTNCVFNPSTIQSGEAYNLGMEMNANIDFSTDSIKFNTKEIQAIKILSSTVTGKGQLKKLKFKNLNSPSYCLYDGTTVHDTASLVIEAGVVIKCRNYNSGIWANGTLTGIGTEAEPIIFTSIADDNFGNPKDAENNGQASIGNSSSGRIGIYSTATSKIKYWKIYYGGYNSDNWAVYVSKGNSVENCEINNSYRGIYFSDNAQLLNNSFSNINWYPVGRYLNAGNPVLLGNTVSNVGYIGIFLPGIANESVSLKPMDFAGFTNVAYLIDGDRTIPEGKVLTVDPGVVIKFIDYGRIIINGGLKAIGKVNNKIIFTSYYDDSAAGDSNNNGTANVPGNNNWSGLDFTGTSSDADNILKNCEVRYCGYYWWSRNAVIQMTDCKVVIDSTLVNFSQYCALGIYGTANPVISNTNLYNLGNAPVYMDMFSNPTFGANIKVANLPRIGLLIRGGSVSGTVPTRNFAGFDKITYLVEEELTVPNSKELIIPAGLTFKSSAPWRIRGKLTVQGVAGNQVVFTSQEDDAYGNPKDTQQNGNLNPGNNGTYFVFYDEADDLSKIEYALFRYSGTIPVQTNNASPKILNSTFQNLAYEGVSLAGSSKPSINNCTFNNVTFPFRTSLVTYPAETTGNTISGTTGRAIRITDETLTQNATLSKRAFADKTNIPYVFGNYTVGSGAILTINPGVVCKFLSSGYLSVYNGLIAKGGSTTDSTIVFTADRDDFYGGDTYGDGDANLPSSNYWRSIFFNNEAIDENCILENCIIKNASDIYCCPEYAGYDANRYGAIALDNASPTIKNCLFESNYYAITSRNTSLPKITNCDFVNTGPYGYAIMNLTSANTVTALNCWWNSNSGPKHASNPAGTGERVTDNVVFTPWATQLAKPVLGDVSMNGEVKPYDASLVLQHAAGNITLSTKQKSVADVSGNGVVSAFDASLILQYSVGLISRFDPQPGKKSAMASDLATISYPDQIIEPTKKTFEIPVTISTTQGIKALDLRFAIDKNHLKFIELNKSGLPAELSIATGFDTQNSEIILSMASAYDLDLVGKAFILEFEFLDSEVKESQFGLTFGMANDYYLNDLPSFMMISNSELTGTSSLQNSKNPTAYADQTGIHAQFKLSKPGQNVQFQVVDVTGRIIYRKSLKNLGSGVQKLDLGHTDLQNPRDGVYVLTIKGEEFSYSKKLLIK